MGNQFLVYASDVTLLEKKINTTRKVTDDPFDASWLKKKKRGQIQRKLNVYSCFVTPECKTKL